MNSHPTLNSFIPLTKLGEGTFSSVYKVRRISDNLIYALKKIKIGSLKQKQKANALNEIRILASLTSNYIITYKEAFFDQKLQLLCIIMELANQGDLLNRITQYKEKKKSLNEEEIWKASYHIVSGLALLHKNNILHRDLKSANIFICQGVYKLGDMNVSKVNDQQQRLVKTQTGTPFYASPQIWRDQHYDSQSDIWSLGCILYEMCCSKPPFNGRDLSQLYKNVQKGYYEPIPKIYSNELGELIKRCLSLKAKERPTASQLLKPNGLIVLKCDYYEIELEKEETSNDILLATIKMPTDLKKLNSKLPQSKYQSIQSVNHIAHQKQIKEAKESEVSKLTMLKKARSDENMMIGKVGIKGSGLIIRHQGDQVKEELNTKEKILSIPDKIKRHLNNMNDFKQQQRLKERIQSRNQIDMKAQKTPNLKYKEHYYNPHKQEMLSSKRKRPLSCNYLQPSHHLQQSPTYFLSNLKQSSKQPLNAYHSDRKPLIGSPFKQNPHHQMFSDRKIYRDHRGSEDQRLKRQKLRCESANPNYRGYPEIRQKYSKYKNQLITASANVVERPYPKRQLKSQPNQYYQNANISSSYMIPTSLSSHLSNANRNQSRYYQKNNSSYLYQIQHKILNNNSNLLKGRNPLLENDSQIKRLVKGQHFYHNKNKY